MSETAIMNRARTAYSLPPGNRAEDFYERHKETYVNPDSRLYGSVLVEMERRVSGVKITLAFDRFRVWRRPWAWFRYRQLSMGALGFRLFAEESVDSRPGRVLRDHLSETSGGTP